jgi:UDP-N-acetyl-D-glucosamine dehydrogenase
MRPTHSNMIFPGPGIGGYCLPKDGGLGYWSYRHILGFEDGESLFKITPTAIDINDTRGLHVAQLVRDALRNMARYIAGSQVLICGASYRQDVGDTRYSGKSLVLITSCKNFSTLLRASISQPLHTRQKSRMLETYSLPGITRSKL